MSSAASTSTYLDNLYQEKFGRKPDASGKAYWTKQIEQGADLSAVANAFDASDEAKRREQTNTAKGVANASTVRLSDNLTDPTTKQAARRHEEENLGKVSLTKSYQTTFNNTANNIASSNSSSGSTNNVTITPSSSNSSSSSSGPVMGPVNTSSNNSGGGSSSSSSTITTTGISDEQKIEDLYKNILGRDSDADGKDYWVKSLKSGTPLAEIKNAFLKSPEFDKTSTEWLKNQYKDQLNRELDPTGKDITGADYWLDELKSGKSRADVKRDIGLNDEAWLAGIYESVLKRPLSGLDPSSGAAGVGAGWDDGSVDGELTGGREYWMKDLETLMAGGMSSEEARASVLANINRSDEKRCLDSTGVAMNVNYATGECGETPVGDCPAGQTRNPSTGACETPVIPDPGCDPGFSMVNGTCVEDDDDTTQTCQTGYTWNGTACQKDSTGDDDDNPSTNPGSGTDPGDEGNWMGPGNESDPLDDPSGAYSKDDPTQSYTNKKKEYQELFALTQGDRDRLDKGDSSYTGGEVGAYTKGTSRLTTGRTVGGNQASIRPTNLKSGGASYSNQSDDPGMITSGPKARDDRPYAKSGMKKGAGRNTSFFFDKRYL